MAAPSTNRLPIHSAITLFVALWGLGPVLWPGSSWAADSFVAFESGHVRPLALSPSGQYLFAVNSPDNRLEMFQVRDGGLKWIGEEVVGLERGLLPAPGPAVRRRLSPQMLGQL